MNSYCKTWFGVLISLIVAGCSTSDSSSATHSATNPFQYPNEANSGMGSKDAALRAEIAGRKQETSEKSNALFVLEGTTIAPRVIFSPVPEYPPALVKTPVEATVFVRLIVTEQGKVAEVGIDHSSDARFDECALAAVKRWLFQPGLVKGKAVNMRVIVPVIFKGF